MTDKEFFALKGISIHNYTAFIFFPAVCLLFILFGYTVPVVIIIEVVLLCLLLASFIPRTVFFVRYPQFIAKKRFHFETISYIASLIFAISTAFAVKKDGAVFSYYFLNIYIQPAFIIYTFVVLGYMAGTAKRVSKIYLSEHKIRKEQDIVT